MRLLTTDIYEGAYFLSQGMQLEKLWQNGKNGPDARQVSSGAGRRRIVFEFSGNKVELLRKDYQIGKACANVIRLKQSLNELKDRMFNLMRIEERRINHEKPTVTFR